MTKLCPKCQGLMDTNSYFGEWICGSCDYTEPIRNNLWIEKLDYIIENNDISPIARVPNNRELMDKINEIIKVMNGITNPRCNI